MPITKMLYIDKRSNWLRVWTVWIMINTQYLNDHHQGVVTAQCIYPSKNSHTNITLSQSSGPWSCGPWNIPLMNRVGVELMNPWRWCGLLNPPTKTAWRRSLFLCHMCKHQPPDGLHNKSHTQHTATERNIKMNHFLFNIISTSVIWVMVPEGSYWGFFLSQPGHFRVWNSDKFPSTIADLQVIESWPIYTSESDFNL